MEDDPVREAQGPLGVYAFLFDPEEPEAVPMHRFYTEALRAILASDPQHSLDTCLRTGAILIANLAYRTVSVENIVTPSIPGRDRIPGRVASSTEWRREANMPLFRFLVQEFSEAVCDGWNTIDEASIFLGAGSSQLEAVALSPVRRPTARGIDLKMAAVRGYLGAAEIDTGHPLLRHLLVEAMISNAFLRGGQLFVEKGGDTPAMVGIANNVPMISSELPRDEFARTRPGETFAGAVSDRGRRAQAMMSELGRESPRERVANGLLRAASRRPERDLCFSFSTSMPDGFAEIVIPEDKLKKYALNKDYDGDGAGKARVFEAALGFTASHSDELAQQIRDGLPKAEFHKIRVAEHGMKWEAYVPVKGRNGAVRDVVTAWITKTGQPARLTSAYVKKRRPGTSGD